MGATAKPVSHRIVDAATVLATILAVSIVGWRLYGVWAPGPGWTETVEEWKEYTSAGHRIGPLDAPVTVIEFFNFECSVCRRVSSFVAHLPERHSGRVAVVYRHYASGDMGLEPALASECASREGKFMAMHDKLYWEPERFGIKPWTAYAVDAGVSDTTAFRNCMAAPETMATIVRDTLAANRLNARGTPTFLINEILVHGYRGEAVLDSVINVAYEATRSGSK